MFSIVLQFLCVYAYNKVTSNTGVGTPPGVNIAGLIVLSAMAIFKPMHMHIDCVNYDY